MNEYDRWKTESREDEQERQRGAEGRFWDYVESQAGPPSPRPLACDNFKASFYARSICSYCGRAFTMHAQQVGLGQVV